MTSLPQHSSGSSGSPEADAARRLQMLAALDIDVWQVRTGAVANRLADLSSAPANAESSQATPSAGPPVGEAAAASHVPASGAAAEAFAMLSELTNAGNKQTRDTPSTAAAQSPADKAVPADASASATDSRSGATPTPAVAALPEVQLDLWCLAGPHGVLLADMVGLSPPAQRLLKDIYQASQRAISLRLQASSAEAGGVAESATKPGKIKPRSLRFSWPPLETAGGSGAAAHAPGPQPGRAAGRALRGFLARQLENTSEAVLLFGSTDLAEVLTTVDLGIPAERQVAIGDHAELEAMMDDGGRKRALWQTLSAL